jgi:hypothetical protein
MHALDDLKDDSEKDKENYQVESKQIVKDTKPAIVIPVPQLLFEAERAIRDLCEQTSVLRIAKDVADRDKIEALHEAAGFKQRADMLNEQLRTIEARFKSSIEEGISMKSILWKRRELAYQEELEDVKRRYKEKEMELDSVRRHLNEVRERSKREIQEREELIGSLRVRTQMLEEERHSNIKEKLMPLSTGTNGQISLPQVESHKVISNHGLDQTMGATIDLSSSPEDLINQLIRLQTMMDHHWQEHSMNWNHRYDDLVANLRRDSIDIRTKLETMTENFNASQQDCLHWKHNYEKESKVRRKFRIRNDEDEISI